MDDVEMRHRRVPSGVDGGGLCASQVSRLAEAVHAHHVVGSVDESFVAYNTGEACFIQHLIQPFDVALCHQLCAGSLSRDRDSHGLEDFLSLSCTLAHLFILGQVTQASNLLS